MNLGLLEYGIVIMAFVITYLASNRLISLLIELKREVLDYHKEGKKFVAYPGGPAIILGLISALLVSILYLGGWGFPIPVELISKFLNLHTKKP